VSSMHLRSERLGWQQRGYDAGRYDRAKIVPKEEPARTLYLRGYRIGRREMLRAQAEQR
jgi:hypothetical protein